MAVATFGVVGVIATPTSTAQAQTKMSMKSIPKAYRGTWYQGVKGAPTSYMAVRVSAKSYTWFTINIKYQVPTKYRIHQLNLNRSKAAKLTAKNSDWNAAFMNRHQLVLASWPDYTKTTWRKNYSEMMKITTIKYKGKRVKVLASRIDLQKHPDYYFKTKTMAKHFPY
ncbi:hypothetical protein [Levilactobacillus zymae]|uniref:hypothetical protein n=1 Tax=Levilactobacillus zymae TaxID=267363 RepID=UPI0028B664B2|nr:hypothetical protein [Levilactobacillus zymae]MDT6979608.1 hypothetical protein [Levilactobacillus zymae]